MTDPSVLDSIIIICAEQSGRPAAAGSNLVTDLGLDSMDLVFVTQIIEQQFPGIGDVDYDPARMETILDVASFVEERLNLGTVIKAAASV